MRSWLDEPKLELGAAASTYVSAVGVNVRDRGLGVITGCGHSGIVNIVRYARKLTGTERVYAEAVADFRRPAGD